MYLVDTDWIADYFGGKQTAVDLLESLKHGGTLSRFSVALPLSI
jgi:hypothetical protein